LKKTVDIRDAKTNLSTLIAEVEKGAEVVIARAGKPVAKLVPLKAHARNLPSRKPGFMKTHIRIGPDFDDPLPEDVLAAFRGERD
jgi:prevent-host-death family protein